MKHLAPDRVAELGPAWAGSSVNCKPYAVEALIRTRSKSGSEQVTGTFFDAEGRLCVYAVDEGLERASVARFPSQRPPMDAHDTPALQADVAGRLMVMASAHRSRPTWLISPPDGGIEDLSDRTDQLPDEMDGASYPTLIRLSPSNELRLLYRLGVPDRSHWRFTAWQPGSETWSRPRSVLSGMINDSWPAGPYPNQPIILDGDRFGLAYCWRSTSIDGGKTKPMNIGMDYVESTGDLSSVRTGSGVSLFVPVSPANSERVIAVPWGADLMNQSGAAAIDGRIPCFATSWRDESRRSQIQFCWRSETGTWRFVPVTSLAQDSALTGGGTLPTLFSRPFVVAAGGGRVLVLYRTPDAGGRLVAQRLRAPDFNPRKFPPLVLIDGGLDQYEPVAERLSAAQSGWLNVFVQRCAQHLGGDKEEHRASAPARLCSWRIDRLFR